MKGSLFVQNLGLTCKHSTRLERLARFSLLGLFASDREDKMFLRLKFGVMRLFSFYLTNIPNNLVCLFFGWLGKSPLYCRLLALLANIRQGWKTLLGLLVIDKNDTSCIKLKPWAKNKNLFTILLMGEISQSVCICECFIRLKPVLVRDSSGSAVHKSPSLDWRCREPILRWTCFVFKRSLFYIDEWVSLTFGS